MSVTIDKAGRLVIPKEIREKAGITPGMPLNITVENGAIKLEPDYIPVRLEKWGHLTVLVTDADVPLMTREEADRQLEEARLEREREILGPHK